MFGGLQCQCCLRAPFKYPTIKVICQSCKAVRGSAFYRRGLIENKNVKESKIILVSLTFILTVMKRLYPQLICSLLNHYRTLIVGWSRFNKANDATLFGCVSGRSFIYLYKINGIHVDPRHDSRPRSKSENPRELQPKCSVLSRDRRPIELDS